MIAYILIFVLGVVVFIQNVMIEKAQKQIDFLALATVALLPECDSNPDPVAGFNILSRKIDRVFGPKQ